jgi:hypothetical protein
MSAARELLDLQFIEARNLAVELAAFLDRMDRHQAADPRLDALRACLPLLASGKPDRAAGILAMLSHDPLGPVPDCGSGVACGAPVPLSPPLEP